MEVSGQLHAPVTLPPGEKVPGTHWIGGWMGLCGEEETRSRVVQPVSIPIPVSSTGNSKLKLRSEYNLSEIIIRECMKC
jgi:hypothetical protein